MHVDTREVITGPPRGVLTFEDPWPPREGLRMTDELGQLGRFAEPSLLILVSLSDGPKHGYAIMTDVAALPGASIGPGTLYAALARLEALVRVGLQRLERPASG